MWQLQRKNIGPLLQVGKNCLNQKLGKHNKVQNMGRKKTFGQRERHKGCVRTGRDIQIFCIGKSRYFLQCEPTLSSLCDFHTVPIFYGTLELFFWTLDIDVKRVGDKQGGVGGVKGAYDQNVKFFTTRRKMTNVSHANQKCP